MATQVKSTGGAVNHINYPLVWCPKYRRAVLMGQITERLTQLLKEIAAKWGLTIIAYEAMLDHVHLFVSAPPKYSPAKLAQLFKGAMAHQLREEFPKLK